MRLGLVVVGVVLGTSAVAGPRPGKVVRVERRQHALLGTPRVCQMTAANEITGFCIGRAPAPGEKMLVADTSRVLGTVRLTSITPYADGCNHSMVWMYQGALETGDVANPQGQLYGFLDVPIDARTGHLVAVDHAPNGQPWGADQIVAVDLDGNGSVDLEFVQYVCDDSGAQVQTATGQCLDVYAQRTKGLERIRQDRIRNCF